MNDQREIWHRSIKPHPSIFVLNAATGITWNTSHRNVWIENAQIPASWALTRDHALTGIPANDWHLSLRPEACLDIVPLDDGQQALRPYGFTDPFRGAWSDPSTRYLEEPLLQWMEKRELKAAFDHLPPDTDIQSLPLFPVVAEAASEDAFIQWMLDDDPPKDPAFTQRWLTADRLSADALGDRWHATLSEEQRQTLRLQSLPLLAKNYSRSVFYLLDLHRLARTCVEHHLPLPEELPPTEGGWLPMHDRMFRAAYLRNSGRDSSEQKSFKAWYISGK